MTALSATNVNGTVATANVSLYEQVTAFTTNQSFYPIFSNINASGNTVAGVNSSLSYNPSTGNLSATGFVGSGQFLTGVVATNANVAYYDVITPLSNNQTYYLEFSNISAAGNSITGVVSTVNVNPSTSTISALAFAGGSGAFTTLNATGITQITNSTASTSTSTGALQVTGGIGVLGNVWVGGNLYVANLISTTQNTVTIQDPLIYLQALGNLSQYNYDIGFYSDYTAPIYAHTGLARNYSTNVWAFFSNVVSEPGIGGINWSDVGIAYDTVKLGSLIVANSTVATSTTSGAVQVTGGVGIQGNLYAAGIQNTPIGNTTPSTGNFTTLNVSGNTLLGLTQAAAINNTPIGNATASTGAFTTADIQIYDESEIELDDDRK